MMIDSKTQVTTIIKVIVISIVLDTVFEYFIYFQPQLRSLAATVIYEKEWDVIEVNLFRNRYFVSIYDAALIPILFYFAYLSKKLLNKFFFLSLISAVVLFTILSNFRTQFFMAILAMFSLFVLYQQSLRKNWIALLTIFISLFLFNFIATSANEEIAGYTTVDRVIDPEEQDYNSLSSRFDLWMQSIEMASSSPLFGVGLRNYFDNLQINSLSRFSPQNQKFQSITLAHPHSIFFGTLAETGIIGLLSLLGLLFYFIHSDVREYRTTGLLTKSLITCFWILFSFSVLNPPDTLPYLSLFWILRGLIAKST